MAPHQHRCALRALRVLALLIALVLVVSSISGCGWRLRGSLAAQEISLPSIYVQDEKVSQALSLGLHRSLRAHQVELVDKPLAGWHLNLDAEQQHRRVLSVDSSGRVQEYELQYSVRFSVQTADGEWLIRAEDIRTQRDYEFDEADVLAKTKEQDQLFAVMRATVVNQLLLRLQSLTYAD